MAKDVKVATPEMLNAIREEASPMYQAAVPMATANNLTDVGNPIVNYEAMANEFLPALMNKIVMQLIDRRLYRNPLAILKRGQMPLGIDIEESHANPAQGVKYSGEESAMPDLLKMYRPDVATLYYRLNRQERYSVTINNDQLRGAFTAWDKMESFIGMLTDTLYNGCTIDDFVYTKRLVSDAVVNNKIVTETVPRPVDKESSAVFMKKVRGLSAGFIYPTSKYNAYKLVNPTGTARITMSPIDEQIIIIRTDVATDVGVDLFANVFGVEYADYLARQIMVDDFGDEDTLAVVADRRAFMIWEQMRKFTNFYNAATLSWQYFYHAWDLFALSPLYNAVAIKAGA